MTVRIQALAIHGRMVMKVAVKPLRGFQHSGKVWRSRREKIAGPHLSGLPKPTVAAARARTFLSSDLHPCRERLGRKICFRSRLRFGANLSRYVPRYTYSGT